MIVIKRLTKKLSKVSFTLVFLLSILICCYYINISFMLNYDTKPSRQLNLNKSRKYIIQNKYMLLWTSHATTPFIYFGSGNTVFVKKKCKWTNCYVTNDRNYLGDYTEFDVIAFHGPQLPPMLTFGDIPKRRNLNQKYVFANIEASANYPLCTNVWNGFFNWTWTYKLNSDAVWGYLVIRNASNHVIGPNTNMNWIKWEDMDEVDEEQKNKLITKTRPAAWFASNCMTQSLRELYVRELTGHLRKFSMDINVYGKCGQFGCPREIMPRCLQTLEKKYYFYLAFENAISEDYVTERIVYALQHNTVPIVFGGANYTRFMPEGMYLNAKDMKAEDLAAKIYEIIRKPSMYYSFFRWKKYYSYHFLYESPDTDEYCKFCAMMNDDQLMKKTTIYENINKWWTGRDIDTICHPTSKLDPFVHHLQNPNY